MTTERPYKRAKTVERACAELREEDPGHRQVVGRRGDAREIDRAAALEQADLVAAG